ncbi:MAG: UDP-N-acetylglucosamine 4,6-dehydratase [Crocinitomicaceae bacterium]|nr:UDP-N-acetylglucosamine 4,6-dehydratase [Crocinitomicaceae bacterium]MDG1735219.1 UDP-N-acetylglucosamine 4,6-dehydratase [Crocinitomicaceae bacterium]MDG2506547.1 UDP-N-acetylglucosamine 4,6-dehydratase [Crocinitomicaceae bacterium]
MNILNLIGRKNPLFETDISTKAQQISKNVSSSTFLVLGGAGSIGQAVVKEIFKRGPKKLHVVDISENNLAELVRDIRSSFGYISGDFQTFALDIGSSTYDAFIEKDGEYDYVLNLSALKHVRSEKDPFTLMRMIEVNILNTEKTIQQAIDKGSKKYFCVSTDKAANPVNMMGASKRIMEKFLLRKSSEIAISTARFANVAFSDGSLLHSFKQRLDKQQPIVAPTDVKRYFVTPEESGQLCLMSCLFGDTRDIFFPKLSRELDLITFSSIAEKFLNAQGYEVHICDSEKQARSVVSNDILSKKWPCFFTLSDTTGEKSFEEFYMPNETLDLQTFEKLGIVKSEADFNNDQLNYFLDSIETMRNQNSWSKESIVSLFFEMLPELNYEDKGKYLDSKM